MMRLFVAPATAGAFPLPRETMRPDLLKLFTYHRPTSEQAERYTKLRAAALAYAELVKELTPESAEQTLAIRSIHAASMQANAAIAVNEADADGN